MNSLHFAPNPIVFVSSFFSKISVRVCLHFCYDYKTREIQTTRALVARDASRFGGIFPHQPKKSRLNIKSSLQLDPGQEMFTLQGLRVTGGKLCQFCPKKARLMHH